VRALLSKGQKQKCHQWWPSPVFFTSRRPLGARLQLPGRTHTPARTVHPTSCRVTARASGTGAQAAGVDNVCRPQHIEWSACSVHCNKSPATNGKSAIAAGAACPKLLRAHAAAQAQADPARRGRRASSTAAAPGGGRRTRTAARTCCATATAWSCTCCAWAPRCSACWCPTAPGAWRTWCWAMTARPRTRCGGALRVSRRGAEPIAGWACGETCVWGAAGRWWPRHEQAGRSKHAGVLIVGGRQAQRSGCVVPPAAGAATRFASCKFCQLQLLPARRMMARSRWARECAGGSPMRRRAGRFSSTGGRCSWRATPAAARGRGGAGASSPCAGTRGRPCSCTCTARTARRSAPLLAANARHVDASCATYTDLLARCEEAHAPAGRRCPERTTTMLRDARRAADSAHNPTPTLRCCAARASPGHWMRA